MSGDETSVLKTEEQGAIFTVTLNRPEARNALNIELTRAMQDALRSFESNGALRVMVLTGTDPAFCAGLDLKIFSDPSSPRGEVGELLRGFHVRTKPVIGAINGVCVTGGLELAMGCDFMIASEKARFGDTHAKVGTLAGGGLNSRVPHAIGLRWSKQLSLTAQLIDAATALRIGLVNEVVPHEALMTRAQELAGCVAALDPSLVAETKRILDRGSEGTLLDNIRLEKEGLAARRANGPNSWNATIGKTSAAK